MAAAAAVLAVLPGAARAAVIDDAKAPSSQLERVDVAESLGGRYVRYRQETGGIPVLGSEAVVTDGPGAADLLVDSTAARVRAPGSPAIDRDAAVRTARLATQVTALRAPPRASLAILPDASGGWLVWRVLLPARSPLASFEALVD